MSRLVLLALAAGLAACSAPASPLALSSSHPASADASASPGDARLADLAPVPQPVLPAVLQHEPMEATDHGAMGHGAMPSATASAGPDAAPPATPATLADALDAYLAVHDALAADRLDAAAAGRLADALRQSTETAPAGDAHLWHRMADDVAASQAAADALGRSQTLDEARAAFGQLGVPFASLVEAAGAGDGLERHTCGMTDAPQGGVWLQRAGPPRNPYFGTAMLMCSRGAAPVGHAEDAR